MARVKYVPKADWEIISKYLDEPGIVLIPEYVLPRFSAEDAAVLCQAANNELKLYNYNFGGDADFFVDVIREPGSYAADTVLELAKEEFAKEEDS